MPDSISTPPLAPARPAREWRSAVRGRGRKVALAAALLGAAIGLFIWAPWRSPNPLLMTPALALEGLQAKSLYFNGPAWSSLMERRPDLLHFTLRTADAPTLRSYTQAVQNPKLFRQLDRQERFDKLLLVGDASQYRPLLEHLLETRDWTLAYVDHITVIFQRDGATAWDAQQVDAVLARLGSTSRRERATFLAQTAGKLVAVRRPVEARTLLERARALDPKAPDVWSVQAHYHLERGEWKECEAAADHALQLDRGNLSATGAKAQALYSTKRFAEAYLLSKRLTEKLPNDPGMLFYHAKIAHSARAYEEEEKVLRKLILLAEINDRSAAGYRVYLGQALASAGEAEPALSELRQALEDPELPQVQRAFALDCMKVIQSQGH